VRTGRSRWPRWPRWPSWLIGGVAVIVAITGLTYAPKLVSGGIGWTTEWSEIFTGPAGQGVSPQYWKYDTGQGIFGTGEVETMTNSPGNVHLDGAGDLDITALRQGSMWTSGRIETTQLFGAPSGGELRVIASIKQPSPASGLGYWPAFWLLGPGSWPQHGEIDILEDVNALSDHSGAFHCGNLTTPNPDGTFGPCHEYTGLSSGLQPCAGCQDGYHTYSVIIDRRDPADEQIDWYLDGQLFYSVHQSQVSAPVWTEAVDHGFSIILDLAIGGAYPNARCGCLTPAAQTTSGGTMSVHYVAVYTR
jgi:beta-glucanase (GH16 family)